jgi:hypothetical protein
MKTPSIRTIFVSLLVALGIFYLVAFVHTLLDFFTHIRLNKPLSAYLFWGYLPMIASGMYIAFSRVRGKLLCGALVGALFYVIQFIVTDVLIRAPHFDHSFKPLSFGLGLVCNGCVCSFVVWLTDTLFIKRRWGKG